MFLLNFGIDYHHSQVQWDVVPWRKRVQEPRVVISEISGPFKNLEFEITHQDPSLFIINPAYRWWGLGTGHDLSTDLLSVITTTELKKNLIWPNSGENSDINLRFLCITKKSYKVAHWNGRSWVLMVSKAPPHRFQPFWSTWQHETPCPWTPANIPQGSRHHKAF